MNILTQASHKGCNVPFQRKNRACKRESHKPIRVLHAKKLTNHKKVMYTENNLSEWDPMAESRSSRWLSLEEEDRWCGQCAAIRRPCIAIVHALGDWLMLVGWQNWQSRFVPDVTYATTVWNLSSALTFLELHFSRPESAPRVLL